MASVILRRVGRLPSNILQVSALKVLCSLEYFGINEVDYVEGINGCML